MQLATKHNNIQTGSVLSSGSFGIAKNAKMFHILSDSMYKDKIGSMVRELCSNARDSHVKANTPSKPFTVHLPNAFEPWFSVTDYGVGISADDIYSVLCIYGESTKDTSNDEIGAFGLGAKTPFAYTDNFTVQSRFNGIERMYTACIGEDGMPTLSLQVELETDEPNGFMVMVSVNEGDFSRFQSKLVEQLMFFDVKPEVLNCSNFEWKDVTNNIEYSNDHVTMYSGVYSDPVSGLYLTQGGVCYPLDISELIDIDATTKSFAEALRENNTVLHFQIGEIDVTAPREAVSYDKRTIQNIIDRIARVARIMSREAMVEIQKEDSIWNRAVLFNKHIRVIQKAISQSPLFDKLFAGMDKDRVGLMAVNIDDLVSLKVKAINLVKYNSYRRSSAGTTVKRKVIGNYARHCDEYLTPAKEVTVFLRDTNSKPMARARNYVFENDFPLTLLIEANDGLMSEASRADVAKALRMPVSNVKLLSELEAPKNASRGGSNYTSPKAFQWSTEDTNTTSKEWNRLFDDINDIGVAIWVEMERHDIAWSADTAMVFAALEAGSIDFDLIAVNGRTSQRIRDGKIGDDLIDVETVAQMIKESINKVKSKYTKYARDNAFVEIINRNSVIGTLIKYDMFPELSKQMDNMATKNSNVRDDLHENRWMRRYIDGLHESAAKGTKRAEGILDGIFSEYPMIKYIGGRYGAILEGEELTDVLNYVKSVKAVVDNPA